MDDEQRIKQRIHEIAQRPRNVAINEIEWVVEQLRKYHDVNVRKARHGTLFRVAQSQFMVSSHNPGGKQVKSCYVKEFLGAMIDLEWYEE